MVAPGVLDQHTADIIFLKVLHDCEYGGKRLSFDLFCRALWLVAFRVRPDMNAEAAFELVVAHLDNAHKAAGNPLPDQALQPEDHELDSHVLITLDQFKPSLEHVFRSYCHRNLGNVTPFCHGQGAVRIRERTLRDHMGSLGLGRRSKDLTSTSLRQEESSVAASATQSQKSLEQSPSMESGAGQSLDVSGYNPSTDPLPAAAATTQVRTSSEALQEFSPQSAKSHGTHGFGSPLSPMPSMPSSYFSTAGAGNVNGAPVPKNRRQTMSLDQMQLLCKELCIMPELISRNEVTNIFKRCQFSRSGYGYLTFEEFFEAMGQLAVEAYAKPPFCNSFETPHERVQAFLSTFLPKDKVDLGRDSRQYQRHCTRPAERPLERRGPMLY